jgi:S1-C subfamily serine protease
MTKLRGFLIGLAGGAVGAALVVLVLVFVFNIGDVEQTIVQATPETPTVYSPPSGQVLTPEQIYKSLSPGVVMILSEFQSSGTDIFGQTQSGRALGTGFVVDNQGYIMTNAHVVSDNGQQASKVTVVFNKGGSETQDVEGKLMGVDVSIDVAIIKVDPSEVDLKPLPLGDSDKVVVGEPVVAIGNPLGYDFSITSGIVSATGRTLQAPNGMRIPNGIQTDAAINQGNSGGPLIDGRGLVIGINEQIASQSGGNEGLGFALPINSAISAMAPLKKGEQIQHAWLGITGQNITPENAKVLKVDTTSGVLVAQVTANSPAEKAGIKGGSQTVVAGSQQYVTGGDVIVKVDSTDVKSMADLQAYIATKKPGDKVSLAVVRDGKTQQVEVTLEQWPADL